MIFEANHPSSSPSSFAPNEQIDRWDRQLTRIREARSEGAWLSAIIAEAEENNRKNLGIEAAAEWGGNFVFSQELIQRDRQALEEVGNDSEALCRRYQAEKAAGRISRERIMQVLPDEVVRRFDNGVLDRERALAIVNEGMIVDFEEGFRPNGKTPRLRKKYVTTNSAIHRLAEAQVQQKTAALLPLDKVLQWEGVHFSCLSWAPKKGKACGRMIADTSNNEKDSSVVNATTQEGEDAIRRRYGDICHPTILDVIASVLMMEIREGGRENLVMWKQDLAGAYTLLNLAPANAKVFVFEMIGGFALMFLAGMFGWTSTPFAFQVITRLLLGATSLQIAGMLNLYVDDYLGVSTFQTVKQDRAIARKIAQDLLGPTSVADKDEEGRRLEMLGWVLDLDLWSVSISRENVLKAIFGFFHTSLTDPVPLKQLQKIASWTSRYSFLYAPMGTFTVALHKVAANAEKCQRPQTLSKEGVEEVLVWRTWLCLIATREDNFARTLDSFQPRPSTIRIEYDASLTGIGLVIYRRHEKGWKEMCHGGTTLPFDVGMDSSYQNTCEYCAVLLGLFWLFFEGHCHVGIDIQGDSCSSLQWIKKGRARSLLARRPSLGFHLLLVSSDNVINDTTHIAGILNKQCDGLSRGLTSQEVGLDPAMIVDFSPGSLPMRYLRLCDPTMSGMELIPDIVVLMDSLQECLRQALPLSEKNN